MHSFALQLLQVLKEDVSDFVSPIPNRVQKPKILFIGSPGVGKSSFISSVGKLFHRKASQIAIVEEAGKSCTREVITINYLYRCRLGLNYISFTLHLAYYLYILHC